jgi:hypothetical protein
MKKSDIRIQIINAGEPCDQTLIYVALIGAKGPAMGILQVYDDETETWWSVEMVSTKPQKRIVTQ